MVDIEDIKKEIKKETEDLIKKTLKEILVMLKEMERKRATDSLRFSAVESRLSDVEIEMYKLDELGLPQVKKTVDRWEHEKKEINEKAEEAYDSYFG